MTGSTSKLFFRFCQAISAAGFETRSQALATHGWAGWDPRPEGRGLGGDLRAEALNQADGGAFPMGTRQSGPPTRQIRLVLRQAQDEVGQLPRHGHGGRQASERDGEGRCDVSTIGNNAIPSHFIGFAY